MAWEYLRSCYSFTMRVFVGSVETLVPARWFWCAPGAKPFPGPHGCAASPWLDNLEINLAWGEVTPWPRDPSSSVFKGLDRGLNPGYPGQTYVGQAQWFLDGMLPPDIMADPVPPMCPKCLPPPAVGRGPIILQGGSFVPPVVPCQACPGGVGHSTYTLTAQGGTGDYAQANGTFLLSYQNFCTWVSLGTGVNFAWRLTFSTVGILGWNITLQTGMPVFGETIWHATLQAWDCAQQQQNGSIAFNNLMGTPPQITVS